MFFRKKQKFETDELLRLLKALTSAPSSPHSEVLNQFNHIAATYKTLDKIPYDQGMKLVELFEATQDKPPQTNAE